MLKKEIPKQDNYLIRWAVILTLGLIIYYQTFGFGFVFDDDWFIVSSPYIKDFSRLGGIFEQFPFTRTLGFVSFALNYAVHGLNPFGYHLVNFLIHLTAVALVWGISSILVKQVYKHVLPPKGIKAKQDKRDFISQMPFLIALLFLVHPGQTQAVSYITQRFESLATVFYLSVFYFYLLARLATDARRILFFVLAGIGALLGILTKEIVATVPVMLLAAEALVMPAVLSFKFKQKQQGYISSRRMLMMLAAVAVIFALMFMTLVKTDLRIFAQVTESESHDGDIMTAGEYLLTQMRVFLTFVRLLIVPVGQNLDYDYPKSTGLLQPPLTLVGLLVIAAMMILSVYVRRKHPLIAFGLAWMLIAFSINLAPRANVIFEHKLYLISFGFFLASLSFLSTLPLSSRVLKGGVVLIVLLLTFLSYQRNEVWQSNLTLWQDVIKKSPSKQRSNVNLGLSYMEAGRYEEALFYLNKVMRPIDLKSHLARGSIYYETGNDAKAAEDFNHVLALDPQYADAYMRRAKLYKRQGQYQLALEDLDNVIRLDPGNEKPYIDRAIIRMIQGNADEALKDLQTALRIDPLNYSALIDMAGVYVFQRQYEEAIKELNKAQRVKASDPRLYKNRALCYLSLGRMEDALGDMRRVLALDPDDRQVQKKYQELTGLK